LFLRGPCPGTGLRFRGPAPTRKRGLAPRVISPAMFSARRQPPGDPAAGAEFTTGSRPGRVVASAASLSRPVRGRPSRRAINRSPDGGELAPDRRVATVAPGPRDPGGSGDPAGPSHRGACLLRATGRRRPGDGRACGDRPSPRAARSRDGDASAPRRSRGSAEGRDPPPRDPAPIVPRAPGGRGAASPARTTVRPHRLRRRRPPAGRASAARVGRTRPCRTLPDRDHPGLTWPEQPPGPAPGPAPVPVPRRPFQG
jgi:hypothetical protein